MKKKNVLRMMKSAAAVVAAVGMLLAGDSFTYLAEANESDTSSTLANLVVFVNFADTTTHTHLNNPSSGNYCFMDTPKITEYFTGDESHPKALSSYIHNISYGQLEVENVIPQYDATTDLVTPVTLSNGIDYYGDDSANGDSYMIQEVVSKLNESGLIDSSVNLDRNGDGCIDNLMLVIASGSDEQNKKFNGHMAYYAGSDAINGTQVSGYTVIPEYRSYQSIVGQSGVIIHEYLHSLGYMDLYTSESGAYSQRYPVSQWDIMASASDYLQYPLAYYRSTVSKWFSIPTVTTDQKSYTIQAVSATDSSNKDNQAVIIKTDYSTNEFFVVEYRKQSTKTEIPGYDEKIPGSGLVIYRINAAAERGNITAPPYGAYVFRQGDDITEGLELADSSALMNTSFFSAESGRTSYGNADKSKGLSDNAITYSDGTNSGIVISNIGSATGDSISFDITFAKVDSTKEWSTRSADSTETQFNTLSSCRDAEGNFYIAGVNGNNISLLKYDGNSWTKVAEGLSGGYGIKPVVQEYQGNLYLAYVNASYQPVLARVDGTKFVNIVIGSETVNEVDLVAGTSGGYMTYADSDGKNVIVYEYTGTGEAKKLGENVCDGTEKYVANAMVASESDDIYVGYRDAFADNKLYVKRYDSSSGTWNAILDGTLQGNSFVLTSHKGKIYLAKNGTTAGVYGSYLYAYDPSEKTASWQQVGDNAFSDGNVMETSITFNGDVPCIAYTDGESASYGMILENDSWTALGDKLLNANAEALNLYYDNGQAQAVVLDLGTSKTIIRFLEIKEQGGEDQGGGTDQGGGPDQGGDQSGGDKEPEEHTHTWDAGTVTVAPGCETAGIRTYTCKTCSETKTENIAATGHSFGDYKITKAATCTATGTKQRICKNCNKTETATIAATGHSFGDYKITKAATCTATGTKQRTCKNCNKTETATIAATGHSWDNGKITTKATYTSAGVKTYTCKNCKLTRTESVAKLQTPEGHISYRTHVQTYGWQDWKADGNMSGTSGQSKRLEGINIKLSDPAYSGSVVYRTHIQTYGWESEWKRNGSMSGTSGEAKRLEAIEIKLTGQMAEKYDVYYRVHAQTYGWLDWAKNGEAAGTAGYAKRLEGIEIKLVKKGASAPGSMATPYVTKGLVSYQTHVQTYGWQGLVYDGAVSGTVGEAKRLEGIKINLADTSTDGEIYYRTHIQTYGWESDWKKNGSMSGTSGEAKRLEAIEIKLAGQMAEKYDIYYRVHAQTFGWLDWAKNGEAAGTAGYAKRLEGIQIVLVPKGGAAPGSVERAYVEK